MRILLINVPHPAIGSRIPDDHLPPLGLLSVGGPLIDDGHVVRLIDGEFGPTATGDLVAQAVAWRPDAVLFGHSGSTSGHPVIAEVAGAIAARLPGCPIVYGGVYPTYHWREILSEEPHVTAIVRGEGEETARRLMAAIGGGDLSGVPGIAYRRDGVPHANPAAPVIRDLDAYRIGWELIDHARYSYWGGLRAVVVQFSRGCPHLCSYCGQRGFWTRWRHRDPVVFAKELARLHREHGVRVVNFADENPTVSPKAWRAFLEALIAEDVDLILVGSTRADDIVRDADMLGLYKKAGWQRFLLGMENTDEATLQLIRKGGATATDREAIRLLREHGILSMATWVVGFEEETDADHWRGLRQLLSYDPDQIQMLYVTPHRWTPYFRLAADRRVIQTDRRRWDYKHQVLATRHMPPWRVLLWFKLTEMIVQSRPKALRRVLFHPDRGLRHAMRWYTAMGRRVWPYEIWNFLWRDRRTTTGPSVAEFWGVPQDAEEEASAAGAGAPGPRRGPRPLDRPRPPSARAASPRATGRSRRGAFAGRAGGLGSPMRFLGIGDTCDLNALYARLVEDGHAVRVSITEPLCHGVLAGIIERVDGWEGSLPWIRDAGPDGIILFENVSEARGALQDRLRAEGYNVVGGSAYGDRLENDRAFGQAVLHELGFGTAGNWEFDAAEPAVEHIRRRPGRYVLKFSAADTFGAGDNYVGRSVDGRDVAAMVRARMRQREGRPTRFILMDHVVGVEMGVGAYFDGRRFLGPACLDWEHKRFFPGDLGELTGEMGTVVTYERTRTFFDRTLGRLESRLRENGYCGYVNINTIVNDAGIWPLEFTCRFGYPGFAILDPLQETGWAELFRRMTSGEGPPRFATRPGFAVGIVMTTRPFPYIRSWVTEEVGLPVLFEGELTDEDRRNIHYGEVGLADGELVTAGYHGWTLVVTGTGATVAEAQAQANARADRTIIPNVRYRRDIGDKLIAGQWAELERLGLLDPV